MSSRYTDKQRHSREDHGRHSRSSYSDERNDARVKRRRDRDRDKNYDRRSENHGHPGRSGDKRSNHGGDSRSYKLSKSRSKTDRTYNTDTEESDESCGSSSKITKRRLSSDGEEDVPDGRLQPKAKETRNEDECLFDKSTSDKKCSLSDSPKQCLSVMSRDKDGDNGGLNDVGPSLPPNLQKTTSKRNLAKRGETESIGPALPPLMRRKSCQLSGESLDKVSDEVTKRDDDPLQDESYSGSEETRVANLQKRTWPDHGEDQSKSIGPALPPHIRRKVSTDVSESESKPISPHPDIEKEASSDHRGDECQSIGPLLPPHLQRKTSQDHEPVGPALPPRKRKGSAESTSVLLSHLQSKVSPDRSEDENERKSIGPILPAHLQKEASPDHSGDKCQSIGPVLPPRLQRQIPSDDSDENESNSIGPVLPPHLRGKRKDRRDESDDSNDSESDNNCSLGPALPPGSGGKPGVHEDPDVFGPALPPRMTSSTSRILGPSLPPGLKLPSETGERSDDSEDEIIGPMLPEQLIQSNKNLLVHAQLERRAAEVKRKMQQKDEAVDVTKREEWMLELPPEGTVDLGLGPRTFRIKGAPEKGADRSAWTDTPADKLRKQEQAITDAQNGGSSSGASACPPELSVRDIEMEKVVKKHSKKRGKESLLDMHQKELHKKKKKDKEDGKKEERRPFSREMDLKTNVFDEAQKKSIFKKAQLLDSRFSRGEAKYL